jgi:hypothetical protein
MYDSRAARNGRSNGRRSVIKLLHYSVGGKGGGVYSIRSSCSSWP